MPCWLSTFTFPSYSRDYIYQKVEYLSFYGRERRFHPMNFLLDLRKALTEKQEHTSITRLKTGKPNRKDFFFLAPFFLTFDPTNVFYLFSFLLSIPLFFSLSGLTHHIYPNLLFRVEENYNKICVSIQNTSTSLQQMYTHVCIGYIGAKELSLNDCQKVKRTPKYPFNQGNREILLA